MTRVLVVDDDATVAEVLTRYLEREGYDVESVGDGNVALDRARDTLPDLVVLDLMLPGLGGLDVCRQLRAIAPIPVIMLTARGEETDRIVGLELGADDYVAKPFSPRELTARVKAVLRRAAGEVQAGKPSEPITAGRITLDPAAREVTVDGAAVPFTARELDLLAFLMRSPRRAFSREELMEHVWGWKHGDASTVTVHVRRIREKVEVDPSEPRHLVTVWGVGYRFEPGSQGGPASAAESGKERGPRPSGGEREQ